MIDFAGQLPAAPAAHRPGLHEPRVLAEGSHGGVRLRAQGQAQRRGEVAHQPEENRLPRGSQL